MTNQTTKRKTEKRKPLRSNDLLSDDHRRLTDAVEHFLWFCGYSDAPGEITDAILYYRRGQTGITHTHMGTQTFDRLMAALEEFGHPEIEIRRGKQVG